MDKSRTPAGGTVPCGSGPLSPSCYFRRRFSGPWPPRTTSSPGAPAASTRVAGSVVQPRQDGLLLVQGHFGISRDLMSRQMVSSPPCQLGAQRIALLLHLKAGEATPRLRR